MTIPKNPTTTTPKPPRPKLMGIEELAEENRTRIAEEREERPDYEDDAAAAEA